MMLHSLVLGRLRAVGRRPSLAAIALAAVSLLQGCQSLSGGGSAKVDAPPLLLQISLDKSVYRPGEAIVMSVTVVNTTDERISLASLDKTSLSFWFGATREDRRVERPPVVSKLEEKELQTGMARGMVLAPGESATRPFVHTRLTTEGGTFVTQAHMEPFPDVRSAHEGKVFSNPVQYQVVGEPLFKRDNMGLLELEDAIRLASAKAPGDVTLSDSLLIEDEMGFYKWWINLDYREPQGASVRTAYLIDPYLGRIWSDAKPFDPALKKPAAGTPPPRTPLKPRVGPKGGAKAK